MNPCAHSVAALSLCLAAAGTPQAAELVPHPEALAKFEQMEKSIFLYSAEPYTIEQALAKNEVAGLSVVILYDGKPALHRVYGQSIKKKGERTTSSTRYQCASMSKMVSALGVVTAARRGELQLDQSVSAFNAEHKGTLLTEWADKYFNDEKAGWTRDITLRRLLSHSAGLDVHGISAAPWLPSSEPLESILFGKSLFKEAVKPLYEPGTRYEYSGGGYTVAEAWLEIASGMKFKDYLKQRVLDPLGMSQSTFETADEDTPNLAWGCSRGVCLYNVRTLDVKAAGGLLCHPVDYARLVGLIMNRGKEYLPTGAGTRLIEADDIKAMLTPSQHKSTQAPIPSDGEHYGLGVELSTDKSVDGLPIRFSHGGAQQGFSNRFYAHRDRKVGIVVLVNGDREWTKNKEDYGGSTLQRAVINAFKVAYGLEDRGVPLTPRCSKNSDCSDGEYCNAGIDLNKNECVPKKPDNAACDLVNGAHQCQSGRCNVGRCYTPGTVAMGGTCYVDGACTNGKCSSLPGTAGTCVCQGDGDCASGSFCNAGLDLKQNKCEAKRADNEACSLIDGGRTCQSGSCLAGRCTTPNSVAMGGTCYVDSACRLGKCSSVDGTRGSCVCDADADCGSSGWCDRGADFKLNVCKAKLNDGAVCGTVGELGVGHRCKSGDCKVSGLSKDLKCR